MSELGEGETQAMIITIARRSREWLFQCELDGRLVGAGNSSNPQGVLDGIEEWLVRLIEANPEQSA